ncbi:MAG: hypothetical protein GEU73_05440 [Chloroflexi bacterium]|nr:hypothetical protein [Chloroflexota bacterium]
MNEGDLIMAGVRLVIQFTAENAEDSEQRVRALAERCQRVASEPGCQQFEVFQSAVRPNVYALLEHWETDRALEDHLAAMGGEPPRTPGTTRERYQHQTSQ